jgi:geranylgeranyl reductase
MEIAIIGGGPAGALAADRLAQAGRRVTLFHDDARPEKPCGGGIPWRGLQRAPFLLEPELPRKVVSRLVLVAPSGAATEVVLDEPVHVFSRRDLDGFLRRRAVAAGARLIPRHVRGIEVTAAGRLELRDSAGERHVFDQVAGADGADSLVRRTFLGRRPRRAVAQALGWYIPGVSDQRLIIRFESGLAGYHWSFPRIDHLAVGSCAPLASLPAAELWRRCARFREGLPDGLAGDPATRLRYAALIPAPLVDAGGRVRVEGEGWALLGDAAGAVDPLTREGIHYALETADLWAQSILDPAGGSYAARFHRAFPRELVWAATRAPRFFDPAFTERLVRYADSSAAIRAVLADLVAGRQPYATLKARLLHCALPVSVALLARRLRGRPRHGVAVPRWPGAA